MRLVPPLLLLCACLPSGFQTEDDTDLFAPDAPRERVRNTHIVYELVGTWYARVPKALQRKFEIIDAGIAKRDPEAFDPPLSKAERVWFDQADNPDRPYREWHYCATNCRFEVGESFLWNHGYSAHTPVGSGLSAPTIDGRNVTFELTEHDPTGMEGTVRVRMSKRWHAFRVDDFEVDNFRGRHLGQKLELYYIHDKDGEIE